MQLTRRDMMTGAAGSIPPLLGMAGAANAAPPLTLGSPLATTPFGEAPTLYLPPPSGSLRARADRKGLYVGNCISADNLFVDAQQAAVAKADCNILESTNGFNWTRTQPQKGMPLNFSQVTPVWQLAQSVGAKFRCHDLTYDLTTPPWAKDMVASMSASQAGDFFASYISQVVQAWRGKVVHWEVCNEPGYELGPPYRPYIFAQKLGWNYLDVAYHAAHAADPNAILFTNAAALEPVGKIFDIFRAGMLKLLEGMLKRGAPIQALGIEGHIRSDYPFSQQTFSKFLDEVTGMGLKIMVTEFDINDRSFSPNVATRDAQCAAFGKAFLDVCLHYPQCMGVIAWQVGDSVSWLNSKAASDRQRPDGQPLRPTLYDAQYHRKPLWSALAAAIDGAPPRPRMV